MIFTINRVKFLRAVTASAAVTDADASLPALGNIKLDADAEVVVTGSDQYTTVVSSHSAHVERPGSCMVDAKLLRDIVDSMPDSATDIEVERDGYRLHFRHKRSTREIACLDADAYPILAKDPPTFTRVTGPALLRALSVVGHAVSTDESRPNYCGINVICGDGKIIAQATDGHRIAHTEIECETGAFAALLPGRGIKAVRAALTEVGACDVEIGSDGAHATLKAGDSVTTMRLAEAAFPPTHKAFELVTPGVATVNRDMLYAALKKGRVTAKQDEKDRADAMALTIASGEIRLAAIGVKGKSAEIVDCDYSGEGVAFGIQPSYLMDVLAAMVATEVSFHFSNSISPIRITPATSSESKFVVLPQRLP